MSCGCNKKTVKPVQLPAKCASIPANTSSGNANNVRANIPKPVKPVEPPPPTCTNLPPEVDVYPPNGAMVQFPIYALLSTTTPDCSIFYTLDGTDPTKESHEYHGSGIFILDHNHTIKARAFPNDGCPAGPILEVQWEDVIIENFNFAYLCTEADNVGRFPELDPPGFAPNGNANDSNWRLFFTLGALTGIKRIEIYQTDGAGNWNTGQAWATDAYVYPYPKKPDVAFHCYPLVIQSQPGSVQLFNDYQTTLGEYIAADYDWYLWGQQEYDPNLGFYTLRFVLENGSSIYRIIQAICEPPPPPCSKPDIMTVTAFCTPRVDLSGVTPEANQVYSIYRRSIDCGSGEWIAIVSGTSDGAHSFSYQDFDVVHCCTYEYYVSVKCPLTYFYKAGDSFEVTVQCEGVIDLDANRLEGCDGDSITLTWASENCDSLSIDNGIGVVDAQGSITIIPPVGSTTYTITCNNAACGNITANVTVVISATGTDGCGCWNDVVVNMPLQISLTIKSDYNPAGQTFLLNLTWGSSPLPISLVSYTAPNDNISLQPGLCAFGDTETWGLVYQNFQHVTLYRGILNNSPTPQGSYIKLSPGNNQLGNYRDAVVS